MSWRRRFPGFGFSEAPNEPGWSVTRMSAVVVDLLARLGYERYGAQGGDWGAGVVRWLDNYDAGCVVGFHTNFPGGSAHLPMTSGTGCQTLNSGGGRRGARKPRTTGRMHRSSARGR